MIDQILNYIAQWLVWIAEKVVGAMSTLLEYLVGWLNEAFQSIFDWFAGVFSTLATYFTEVIDGITTFFNNIMDGIQEVVSYIWEKFTDLTTSVLDTIREFAENIWSQLRTAIEDMVMSVVTWVEDIFSAIVDVIKQGVDAISSVVETVKSTIIEWVDVVFKAIESIYNDVTQRLTTALNTFLGGASSLITAIESRLSQLKEAFGEMATKMVTAISETAEETFAPIRDSVTEFMTGLVDFADPSETDTLIREMDTATAGGMSAQQLRDFYRYGASKLVPKTPFWRAVFLAIAAVAGALPLMMQLGSISSQVAMQEIAKQIPYALFTPADVTAAWRRGLVSESYAVDTIQRQGYDANNARIILKLSDQVPQEGDILNLWHRGIIDDGTVNDALRQRGLNQEYTDGLKEASFLIPPVTDLITMAVREAFSPEVAERFGQYEDYPEEMTPWVKKQGLSEEWSQRYWASHWALPSPFQGFEMLHRGVIKEEDLNLLLRALDVMPFWRERLTQIAYTPFTRVDIRRMHRVGVLTEKDVLRSYKDIGYNEEKARLMTDFVMLLNEPAKADDETELKTLSRSAVVGFYSDGLIDKDRALELLLEIGYSDDAAHLYLDSADMDAERAERKAEVSLTLSLAKAGIITFVQAEDRLRKIGLETREIDKAITDLVREQEKTIRLPSRSEGEKMYKLKIISEKEYKELLTVLGYAPKWQDAYLAMVQKT